MMFEGTGLSVATQEDRDLADYGRLHQDREKADRGIQEMREKMGGRE